MKKIVLLCVCSLFSLCSVWAGNDDLSATFKHPDKTYYPWIYWYWLNSNINEEGLIADLESMDEAGIGTAMAFDVGIGVPGKVIVRSEEWYRLMKKVILKVDELGMRIGFNCPGWANAGGPWITPETAMKELVWSEAYVKEGDQSICIPASPSRLGFYKDIAVLAYPSLQGDSFHLSPENCSVTDTLGRLIPGFGNLFDNDRETWTHLPGFFDLVLKEPQTIRSMQVRASNLADSRFFVADMWYYDENSSSWEKIAVIPGSPSGLNDRPGMGTYSFDSVTASRFRFGFMTGYGNRSQYSKEVYLQELDLQGSLRNPCWHNKIGFGHNSFEDYDLSAGPHDVVDPASVIDLTSMMKVDGKLDWQVPEGEWTIVRLGYIPTGAMSQPLNRGLVSLECDKYSKSASKVQYDGVMQPLFDLVGKDVARRVFANYHIDSYEVGWQNWSECLPEEFKTRRGYEMDRYLLALTGRIVSSKEETDAFCWDFRRTMADCYADNHIGYITELAHQDGMFFSIEAYDGPFEDLQTAGRTDMPMSEIWQKSNPDAKPRYAAMYAAHIYDKKLVGTEQFTGMGLWDLHPWLMKNNVDASLAYGVNNIAMHVFAQQPWTDKRLTPGATLGPWGSHYDRGNTWFHLTHPWHDYIARCQVMLRQGRHVADYLQYLGDVVPGGGANVALNADYGYEGDALNSEVLARLSVKDGRLILPFGKSYRYLVLPQDGMMNLSSLKKIEELVEEGATILGKRPVGSYSLNDLSRKDEFDAIVKRLFNGHDYKGRVFENLTINEVIQKDSLLPDFSCIDQKGINLKFNHRHCDEMEIYYLANVSTVNGASVECSFRVEGFVPEIWDPMTGERIAILRYEESDGQTKMPLHFEKGEAKFVVFRREAVSPMVKGLEFEGKDLIEDPVLDGALFSLKSDAQDGSVSMLTQKPGKYSVSYAKGDTRTVKVKSIRPEMTISTPWKVRFETRLLSPVPAEGVQSEDGLFTTLKFDQLVDWTKHPEEGIRYYSGTSSYSNTFELKSLEKNERCVLQLGEVNVIAHVYINGKDAGIHWMPSFNVDITDYVHKGQNDLVVEITNLWPNRLIGDEQYPDDVTKKGDWMSGELFEYPDWVRKQSDRPESRRVSFTTFKHWKADDPLLPSGLVGPVKIVFPKTFEL